MPPNSAQSDVMRPEPFAPLEDCEVHPLDYTLQVSDRLVPSCYMPLIMGEAIRGRVYFEVGWKR